MKIIPLLLNTCGKGGHWGLKYVTRQMWSWGRDNKFCNINPASKFFSRYNLPSRSRLAREGFHAGWKPLKMGCEPGLPRTPKRKLHHLEQYGSVVLLLVRRLRPDWGLFPLPDFLVSGGFPRFFSPWLFRRFPMLPGRFSTITKQVSDTRQILPLSRKTQLAGTNLFWEIPPLAPFTAALLISLFQQTL